MIVAQVGDPGEKGILRASAREQQGVIVVNHDHVRHAC